MHAELVTKSGEPIAKGRIRPSLATAIRLIVEQGYTIGDAAKAVGYQRNSLVQAFNKPHVRAFRASVRRAWLNSQTEKAWRTVADLAGSAASEDVRLKAAKVFIEADEETRSRAPEGVRQLVQIVTQHVHMGGEQPLGQRLPGVIEHQAPQRIEHQPSNSQSVGRNDAEPDQDP